jgi:type II secretory pathway component PulM
MGSKARKTFVDYDKHTRRILSACAESYYFGIGLFLLIVITFGLMWFPAKRDGRSSD